MMCHRQWRFALQRIDYIERDASFAHRALAIRDGERGQLHVYSTYFGDDEKPFATTGALRRFFRGEQFRDSSFGKR